MSGMQTTIRTAEPRELLSMIPYQLGFAPERSAVVISLRGARSRVGLIARVDLDDLLDADHGPQVARTLVSHLVADGAHRVVVVLYTDDATGPAGASDRESRAAATFADAAEHLLGEPECWVVGPTGYFGLHCSDRACCPPGGRPLSDLLSTRVGARMVLAGATIAGTRQDLGQVVPASSDARRSARRAAARWERRRTDAQPGTGLARWRAAGLGLWREELASACSDAPGAVGAEPDRAGGTARTGSATAGRLQAALADVIVRDAVLLTFVDGADRVADRVVAGDAGDDVERVLRAIVDPEHGQRPDERRTAGARAVLEQVVAHAARRRRAPALTLLAVLAWWEGDGARADVLVERALESDPGHRLALLVHDTLEAGMPPGWVRRDGDPGRALDADGTALSGMRR